MTDKPWLTRELDEIPYTFDNERFQAYLKTINLEQKHTFILNKCQDEALNAEINSLEKRKVRFIKAATSFLKLEGQDLSFPLQDEAQQLSLEDYYEACVRAYELSQQPFFMPTTNDMIELNAILLRHDEETSKYPKFSLRNEKSPLIIIGKGYFAPVANYNVSKRVSLMLFDLANTNFDDPLFVKGAKFVTEYVRIQPHMSGNKRTALMLLNSMLQTNNYPSIYFDKDRIDQLHDCIKESMLTRDVTNFAILIADCVSKHYDHVMQDIEVYEAKQALDNVQAKTSTPLEKSGRGK